jgi:VanZ family protein
VLPSNRRILLAWLLVLGWVGMILVASGDGLSFSRSSRILRPLLEWLFPSLAPEQMWRVVAGIRKLAHVTEYCLLALLAWRAWRLTHLRRGGPTGGSQLAARVLAFTVACAALDEFRQSYTQSRQGSGWDVLLDSVGAALGLGFVWLWHVWQQRRPRPQP